VSRVCALCSATSQNFQPTILFTLWRHRHAPPPRSESSFIGSALEAVRFGGLLYLTCTDGMSSGGRTPLRALAAYGTYTRALPWANEQVCVCRCFRG
jgi:hypothetical protein